MNYARRTAAVALAAIMGLSIGCAGPAMKSRPSALPTADTTDSREYAAALYAHRAAIDAMREEKFELAEQVLTAMILRFPQYSSPHVNLGLVYAATSRTSDALLEFQRAVEIDPRNPRAYGNLGITLRELGRFDDARQAYLTAIELDPNYAYAHLNLGILYDLYLGSPTDAVRHYRRYLDLDDDDRARVVTWIQQLDEAP